MDSNDLDGVETVAWEVLRKHPLFHNVSNIELEKICKEIREKLAEGEERKPRKMRCPLDKNLECESCRWYVRVPGGKGSKDCVLSMIAVALHYQVKW